MNINPTYKAPFGIHLEDEMAYESSDDMELQPPCPQTLLDHQGIASCNEQELDIPSLWNILEERIEQSPPLELSLHDIHHRFEDIRCPKETAVKVSGQQCMHANWIVIDEETSIIGSQAPSQQDAEIFWQMIFEHSDAVFDVREHIDFAYYAPQKYASGHSLSLLNTTCFPEYQMFEYELHWGGQSKKVTRYHFHGWADRLPPTADMLDTILLLLARHQTPTIHCRAGIGRTGTIAAAYAIKKYFDKPMERHGMLSTVVDIIYNLRHMRGKSCVMNQEQFESLINYQKILRDRRSSSL